MRNATSLIRLITRVIFVWFIKEKGLIPDDLFNPRRLREILTNLANDESSYYQAILQNLFFATLNQEMNTPQRPDSRKFRGDGGQHYNITTLYRHKAHFRDPDAALAYFANIPFLNGGLFECLDKPDADGTVIRIDGFSDRDDVPLRVPNDLFFGAEHEVDLNTTYGTSGKRYQAAGLITILQRYKFTVAENTPIEEEVALDPELLGQVFENLLAAYNPETQTTARKQTGSFYTPRPIVNYMVDEALVSYLEEDLRQATRLSLALDNIQLASLNSRLHELMTYSEADHGFSADEVRHLIIAIDSLRILDPAAGSGAFPMGVLQKLVHILGRLDPGNARWKARQIAKVRETMRSAERIDDANVRDRTLADLEIQIAAIEEAFERNELDYGRKLFLIENCIYGVDIQPIAVQIAKLRCFISLVVDQRIDDARENRGIRPLPNLETKFVAANTLVGIPRPKQMSLRDPEIDQMEERLRDVRARHFSARTPKTKSKYREQDKELRTKLAKLLRRDGFSGDTATMLASWDPYDQNASASFFDSEWMFGLRDGFDVVIANPPYIRIQELTQSQPLLAEHLKQHYKSASKGNYDAYVVFIEHGLNMLRPHGNLSYIIPHKFFITQYGEPLRELIGSGKHLKKIVHFGDQQVFSSVTTYTCLLFLTKKPRHDFSFIRVEDPLAWQNGSGYQEGEIESSRVSGSPWNFVLGGSGKLLKRLSELPLKLANITNRIFQGLVTSADPVYLLDDLGRIQDGYALVYSKATGQEHWIEVDVAKPLCKGARDIHRYYAVPSKRVIFPYDPIASEAAGKTVLIDEGRFINQFPNAWSYLVANKDRLEEREKGKMRHSGWYGYVYPKSVSLFTKKKILTPSIAEKASYTLDKAGDLYFVGSGGGGGGGYGLILKADCGFSYEFILGLLNSSLMDYYLKSISSTFQGGYYAYNRQYIENLPIIKPNMLDVQQRAMLDQVSGIAEEIIGIKRQNNLVDTAPLEKQINALIYQLYGLSAEDINLVEGS